MTKYRVLCADPGWKFDDPLPGKKRGAVKHYRLMNVEDIKTFPLPPLEDDVTLFLWRVASMQKEALDVVDAWGFKPVKAEMIWLKKTKFWKRWFGMGRIVRNEHEVVLIAHRGRPQRLVKNIRSTFEAHAGRHSDKPEKFYQIVEQLYTGPYCELFARRNRPGWDCFGDEIDGDKEKPSK